MSGPDTTRLAAGGAYIFVAVVLAQFLPRLARLGRREPRTRRVTAVWGLLCGVLLAAAAVELCGGPVWAVLTVHFGGLVVAVALLAPYRRDVAAVLRGTLPAPAVAPSSPAPADDGPGGANVIDGVDDARALYGPDPTGSAAGGYAGPERRRPRGWPVLNDTPGERSPTLGADDQDV